ncbi:hypothetical protein ZEAMMB73_Zm00001d030300, partial [Zea mays]
MHAISHSMHRRYLQRKARRDALKESGQSFETSSVVPSIDDDKVLSENSGLEHGLTSTDGLSSVSEIISARSDDFEHQAENDTEIPGEHLHSDQRAYGDDADACTKELENLDIEGEDEGGGDAHFIVDESNEQSWTLRSLSESSIPRYSLCKERDVNLKYEKHKRFNATLCTY